MNFKKRYVPRAAGFQMAPMIDIIFLLLIFFVTSQVFTRWETEVPVKVPTAETGEPPRRMPGEIILNIRSDGRVVVNQKQLDSAALEALLARLAHHFPGQPVLIRADRRTAYEHVIRALDFCRKADIYNISFATGRPEKTAVR